ncbi:hypothetical protein [Micromonospora sp. NPDC049679]|uniref:hypothetical protein n=1 Tax=Micromonospora sp. NPDC049679 TaxID=3155920 RepID=UPI003408135C
MTRTTRRGVAALITAAALSAGLFAAPAPVSAKSKSPRCTVTADQRATAVDQLNAGLNALRGRKPTTAERKALNAAVAELVRAARDAKMSPEVRKAKLAELKALHAKLRAATTAEERLAVRAEMRAIVLDLKAARLTKAERAELAAKIKELKAALRGKLTKSERSTVQASVKAAKTVLTCKVV